MSKIDNLTTIRAEMEKQGFDGLLIPTADAHLNEYVLASAKHREWLSGFDGSAGDALVTHEVAFLFVDGRYHDQADQQLDLTQWTVVKLGKPQQPTLSEKITALMKAKSGFALAVDPFTVTVKQWQEFEKTADVNNGVLKTTEQDWLLSIRKAIDGYAPNPLIPSIRGLAEQTAGQSVVQKLTLVRHKLAEKNATVLPITKLDEIAWLFNLRGQDIAYNPVFVAYAIVTETEAILFTDTDRLKTSAKAALGSIVTLHPYEAYLATLAAVSEGQRVFLDPAGTTQATAEVLHQAKVVAIENGDSPIAPLKAVKNVTELQGMRNAHLAASVALIQAWHWLETSIADGQTVTEKMFADRLSVCYAASPAFQGLSFNTIAGFGPNSAVIHYGTPSENIVLESGSLFLFDSGAQYWLETNTESWMGTTDTTRTIAIGPPSNQDKIWYTAVLKAHIDCAIQRFPKGTKGIQLDAITRAGLWNEGLDFLHGTGHGVGAFLNVHEGPNGISNRNQTALLPGMITSIEPGYYATGIGGIRLENLYEVVETQQRRMPVDDVLLGFETLIYVPFDSTLINNTSLSLNQRQWLTEYHQTTLKKVGPLLSAEEQAWLQTKCSMEAL